MHLFRGFAVFFHVAGNDNQIAAFAFGGGGCHGRVHTVFTCLIVAGGDDPASVFRATYSDGQPCQARVVTDFDGGKKTVAITMNDLSGHGVRGA